MVKDTAADGLGKNGELKADRVEIVYYTDPLCCWSWGLEPQVRKLLYEFDGQIGLRYCMGGLLPAWSNYNDEVNSVSRPIQMGPVWMHAQQISGMPMNSVIWMRDPPSSSYPACIAVKCAGLQSGKYGERYLRLLREAIMLKDKNISRREVLIDVASELSGEIEGFNVQQFKEDLDNDNGLEAFRKDLQDVQYRNINRFPTMIIKTSDGGGIITTGYRPYSNLVESLKKLAPGIEKSQPVTDLQHYINFWGRITKREAEEVVQS